MISNTGMLRAALPATVRRVTRRPRSCRSAWTSTSVRGSPGCVGAGSVRTSPGPGSVSVPPATSSLRTAGSARILTSVPTPGRSDCQTQLSNTTDDIGSLIEKKRKLKLKFKTRAVSVFA